MFHRAEVFITSLFVCSHLISSPLLPFLKLMLINGMSQGLAMLISHVCFSSFMHVLWMLSFLVIVLITMAWICQNVAASTVAMVINVKISMQMPHVFSFLIIMHALQENSWSQNSSSDIHYTRFITHRRYFLFIYLRLEYLILLCSHHVGPVNTWRAYKLQFCCENSEKSETCGIIVKC